MLSDKPLSREDMINVIEGKGCAERIPITYHFWGNGHVMNDYPYDMVNMYINSPSPVAKNGLDPEYRWINLDNIENEKQNEALDAKQYLDWDNLDEVLNKFPSPYSKAAFNFDSPPEDGRYRLALWWYCFFERHWELRGMENALCDYYTNPDEVHRLFRALTDFYKVLIVRAKKELNIDAIMTSDDIGTQTGPFFSLEIFREFFKPYYKELIDTAHENGVHFWLHTCGNIEPFIPEFIEIGLDVLHPIQKYTMNEADIVQKFGGKICIWAGFDVQRTIPYGTPEDCEKEVRFLIDTYARKDGRLILTFGNGLTEDTPSTSVEAVLKESLSYGRKKVEELKGI